MNGPRIPGWATPATLLLGAWSLATAGRFRGDLGDYMPAPVAIGFAVLGCASLAVIGGRRHESMPSGQQTGDSNSTLDDTALPRARRGEFVALLSIIAAVWLATRPELALAATGFGLACIAARAGSRPRLGAAGALVVVSVAATLATGALVDRLALARTEVPFIGEFVGMLLGLLGADAGAGDGTVIHWTVRAARPVTASVNSVGLGVQLTVGAIVATYGLARGAAPIGLIARLGIGCAAALTLRLALVATAGGAADGFVTYSDPSYATGPFMSWQWGSWIDLLAAAALLPLATFSCTSTRSARPSSNAPWVIAVGALAGLLLAYHDFADATSRRVPIRIAIDEGHSRWEPSDLRLDEDLYGQETGYNFRALADWLGTRHGPVRRLYDVLDSAVLIDVDVLILKTPTEALAASEVEALVAFVEAGGGLALIGDHTNVFGTSDVLAPVARRFGFEFEFDCLFDERHRFEHVMRPDSAERHHPVLANVPLVRFEVGCSIRILEPWRVEPIALARGMKSQPIDYAATNFYPMIADHSDMGYGQFTNLVASRAGRGRVIGLSDSTFLSTFSVCLPGRRELIDGVVDWLGREDRIPAPWRVPYPMAVIVGGVLWIVGARRGLQTLALAALACTSVIGLGADLALANQRDLSPSREASEVYFLEPSTDNVIWPVAEMVRDAPRSFNLFYQWVLRTGAFPRLIPDLNRPLPTGAPLVWIDPPSATESQLKVIEKHVLKGGTVIALEVEPNAVVARIAALGGMTLRANDGASSVSAIETARGQIDLGRSTLGWRAIAGGDPLMRGRSASGEPLDVVAATATYGGGAIVIITCGELFNDLGFGVRYDIIPDSDRRLLYQFQFDLINAARGKPGRPSPASPFGL